MITKKNKYISLLKLGGKEIQKRESLRGIQAGVRTAGKYHYTTNPIIKYVKYVHFR